MGWNPDTKTRERRKYARKQVADPEETNDAANVAPNDGDTAKKQAKTEQQ